MRQFPTGKVLEIGCGSGALLHDLAALGHECVGIDWSSDACQLTRTFNRDNPGVSVFEDTNESWQGSFDFVLAFEVLEHIKADLETLVRWSGFLKPGGRLLISVPAHQRKWNAADVGAGHYRRYERTQLAQLLTQAGLAVEHCEIYGFPLANLLEPLRARHLNSKLRKGVLSDAPTDDARANNTASSGTERSLQSRVYPFYASWPARLAMGSCCWLQSLFANTELGNGYLTLARHADTGASL